MATINYQCSVCRRNVDVLEKPYNLNVLSKCIITDGCKGKLNRISRNPDNTRESIPEPVLGLRDYVPRKAFFSFTQNSLSKVWNVIHNLGAVPAVDVYVNDNEKLIKLDISSYKILIKDKNSLSLTFSSPFNGNAQLIARTSVQNYTSVNNVAINNIITTFSGVFVFAVPRYITDVPTSPIDTTLDTNLMQIRVSIIEPNKEEIICVEPILPLKINKTSWIGWKQILLRKRKNYVIKYKSIFSFTNTFSQSVILPSDIPNGTQIRFLEIDYGNGIFQPIEQDKLIILLANSPYESIDKIRNKIIDVGAMLKNDIDYFTYIDGEIYTSDSNIQSTYPMIEKVS